MGSRNWLKDLLSGGIVGGIVGAVAAVNFVIYSGFDEGYETSIGEVFRQNTLFGVITVGLLVAGPVLGVFVARRLRAGRSDPEQPPARR